MFYQSVQLFHIDQGDANDHGNKADCIEQEKRCNAKPGNNESAQAGANDAGHVEKRGVQSNRVR